jgi:hypothetical protein
VEAGRIINTSTHFFLIIYDALGKTLSLTVREEHRLRVFENRVLRRIFGPTRDGVTGGWRKLHKEELNNLYSSSVIITKNGVFWDVTTCSSCNNRRFGGT